MSEARELARIRSRLDAVAPGDWLLASNAEGLFCEVRDATGAPYAIARFSPGASPDEVEFVCGAPGMVRFLLGLVDRAIVEIRNLKRGSSAPVPQRSRKDFAAEAAMKCGEPAFRRFLMERHGLDSPASTERTAQKVRSICGITSRRQLNDDSAAAERWQALRRDFEAWRRVGQ